METWAFGALVLSAFTLPFSLPAARALLVISALLLTWDCLTGRRKAEWPAVAGWMALFVVCVVFSTIRGVHPELGLRKIDKFFWLAMLPVSAMLVTTPERLKTTLSAFAAGTGVLAVKATIMLVIHALRGMQAGSFPDFGTALIMNGSMTDAERLMVGILIVTAFVLACRRAGRPARLWWLLLALQVAALVLQFKRGSWFCTLGVAVVYLALSVNWRFTMATVLAILALGLVPTVRTRLTDLAGEFKGNKGGRMVMWTRVAPVLVRQHPWFGVGYRSLTNRMMRRIDRHVEINRDHLHSNVIQILVESGMVGFAAYVLWMARALADAIRLRRRAAAMSAEAAGLATALLLALIGLLANGLVEYNFGDSEIVMIYGLVMGCAAAGLRWGQPSSPSQIRSGESCCPA